MRLKLIFLLLLLLHLIMQVFGVNNNIKFKKISVEHGLSQSTVLDIVQDSLGFLWLATQDGLNKYDGYEFKIYRNDKNNLNKVKSQYIRKLLVDREGTLWIGGDKGICKYNFGEDNFLNYSIFEENEDTYVTGILEDDEGIIWVSTNNGKLYVFNKQSDSFQRVKYSSKDEILQTIEVIKYKNEYVFIGSETGLFRLDKNNLILDKIRFYETNLVLRDFEFDQNNRFWIATEGDGLFLLDSVFNVVDHYLHSDIDENSLISNFVRKIKIDNSGNIWIGTFHGLSVLNIEKRTFDNFVEESEINYSLSQNSIRSIFIDNDDGVWLGTFYGGLNYYHPERIKFNILNKRSGRIALNDNVISVIREDDDKKLWIGTNDHGLNLLDLGNDKITYFISNSKDKNTLSSNNIKSLLLMEDGSLLVGTHWGGLNHFYPSKGINTVFKKNGSIESLADDRVYALLKDKKGSIWVGTFRGLQKFYPEKGKFEPHYIDSRGRRLTWDEISFLFEDSRNRIWIGTFRGLNIFYPERDIFEPYIYNSKDSTSLSENEITWIHEDVKGRIWIGTKNGLNLFDEIHRSFIRFTTHNGLTNNVIYAILEDEQNNLWLSSNGGLMKFNSESWKCEGFDIIDGIQSTQFNNYSGYKTSQGMMLFGGINGITMFYPSNIKSSKSTNKVLITKLQVNNNVIYANDKSKILSDHISNTKQITLEHKQNSFSVDFVAINFKENEKVDYHYKFEGFEDNWLPANKSRRLSFSNLDPGNYTLQLKIKNNHSETGIITSLVVEVLPPWWLSNLAYVVYFLLFITLTYLTYRFIKERIKAFNALNVERLEKQKLEEIHKMKLQFFTNISHEFKTPLTLIISPLEKLRDSKTNNEWYNKQIDLVYKNAKRLLSLIDQLLEFRKAEMGQMKLKVSRSNLIEFLYEVYLSFSSLARSRNMIYTFDKDIESLYVLFDKSIVEKIMFNLLSNAFKYTQSGGTVSLVINKLDEVVSITVMDTGKGIPKDKQALIFDRFYSIKESNPLGGSGIGLEFTKHLVELHRGKLVLESEPGKGSAFTVTFPILNEVYTISEINEDETHYIIDQAPGIILPDKVSNKENTVNENEKKEKILIVDDNQDIVSYLYDNLSQIYNAETASDGQEALEKLNSTDFDMVISDVVMPKMDGLALCKKIKQNIKTCHIPVILLTVKASTEQQVEGLNVGADDYVGKPFSLKVLETKISNLIKTRKRLKEVYSEKIEIKPEDIAYNLLDQEFLSKAVEIVEKYLADQEFSVDVFSKEMFMSRSNLHLKFKAITGESASEFIKKIRFGKAIDLMESGKYNISEVSYMVGFTSPSYFSSRFKKYFGCLPTEYFKNK